jgi:MFS family permease
VSSYGALLRIPAIARLFGAEVVARLPIGINGIALVLFLRGEGSSFAVAGAAAGGMALGTAFGAPINARLVDRTGRRALLVMAAVHAAGLGMLIALGVAGAPPALIVGGAVVTGASLPPISSVLRASYQALLRDEPQLVQSAFALDSVLTELIFVGGPLVTALLLWAGTAAAALVLSAVAVLAGTALFLAALPEDAFESGHHGARERDWKGALASPGMRTLVLAMVPVGFAFGAIEVTLPAFADSEGDRQLAGVLIAIWSLGSAAGGLLYGARPRQMSLARTHLYAAMLVPVGVGLLALASSPLAMAFLVIPAGLPIAPLIATRNELAGNVAPAGAATEAYTWPLTAMVSGIALGAAAAGALADASGWRSAVAAAAGAAALGALVSVARRGTLVPVAAPA